MEKTWVRILETRKDDPILEYLKEKSDENNIKYKIELEEAWEGSVKNPEYVGKFVIYVQEDFNNEAEKILNQYYEDNIKISEQSQEIEVNEEDLEAEIKKRSKGQKIAIRICAGIIILMIISIIIAGLLT